MLVKKLQEKYLYNPDLAENTIKTYIYNLNKIKKHMGDLSIIRDKGKIKKMILTNELFNKYPYIFFNILLLICRKHYGENHMTSKYYTKLMKKHHKNNENTNELTEKEEKLMMPFSELEEIINKVNYNDFQKIKDLRNFLLVSLYIRNPPRRLIYRNIINIFKKTDINKLDNKFNYVDYHNKTFIFNNHKSKKKFNRQIIKINDELFKVIDLYNQRTNYKNKYLLGDKEIAGPNFTRLLKRVSKLYFNKELSVGMYRKIYISSIHEETFKGVEDINKLGHTVSTSSRYYNKNISENEI